MAKYFLSTENQRVKFAKCVQIFKNLSFRGMNNGMISEKFGTSRRSLDRYATGEEDIPLSTLIRVADISGTDLGVLFGGSPDSSVDAPKVLLETIDRLNKAISEKRGRNSNVKKGGGQLHREACERCFFGRKTTSKLNMYD